MTNTAPVPPPDDDKDDGDGPSVWMLITTTLGTAAGFFAYLVARFGL